MRKQIFFLFFYFIHLESVLFETAASQSFSTLNTSFHPYLKAHLHSDLHNLADPVNAVISSMLHNSPPHPPPAVVSRFQSDAACVSHDVTAQITFELVLHLYPTESYILFQCY